MKRFVSALAALCMLLTLFACPADAAVSATPNQKLAFRTGPNTKYVDMYTLPQSTSLTAIEYEEGNGVTWVLVEFFYQGQRVRAYTGLKRMSVNGSIPWASHLNMTVTVNAEGRVRTAPSQDSGDRGRVAAGESVTLLRYDGDYAFIEFYDGSHGAPSRGWIPSWMIGSGAPAPATATPAPTATPTPAGVTLYAGPGTAYERTTPLSKPSGYIAVECEEGEGTTWVLVEFLDQGRYVRGFARLDGVTVVGEVPPAVNAYRCAAGLTADSIVYAAPKDSAAVHTYLPEDVTVWVLDFVENGYAYIEFASLTSGLLDRGYVQIDRIAIP